MPPELKAYVANCLGFHEIGRLILDEYILPRIRETGITPMEPFTICGPYVPIKETSSTDSYYDRVILWQKFNKKIVTINEQTMLECQLMLPILDGNRDVDEGIADEMRFWYHKGLGSIYALRTDFRRSENIGCIVHPHLQSVIERSEGKLCTSMDEWFDEMEGYYKSYQ